MSIPAPSHSLFLDSLSAESRDLLMSKCQARVMPVRKVLYEPEIQAQYAYFMTSGIASIVTSMPNGATAEVGIVGHEGVVGALHLLGPLPVSTCCFMQIEGSALRISFSELQTAFRESREIRERLLEFVQSQAICLDQLAACNRLHAAEERLSRWLLMVQDRTESDLLTITQEFLAEMLGARRTTVTLIAGGLQRSGIIEYQRGHVRILDRERLESAACVCYPVVQQILSRLYRKTPEPIEEQILRAMVIRQPGNPCAFDKAI